MIMRFLAYIFDFDDSRKALIFLVWVCLLFGYITYMRLIYDGLI
jgi:hypothetical protein